LAKWRLAVGIPGAVFRNHRRLYSDGYRVFIEVGPAGMLTSFVNDILQDSQDVTAVASDSRSTLVYGNSTRCWHKCLWLALRFEPAGLYVHRDIPALDLCAALRPAPNAGIKLKLQMPEFAFPEAGNRCTVNRNARETDFLSYERSDDMDFDVAPLTPEDFSDAYALWESSEVSYCNPRNVIHTYL